jgi:hypothetical protein
MSSRPTAPLPRPLRRARCPAASRRFAPAPLQELRQRLHHLLPSTPPAMCAGRARVRPNPKTQRPCGSRARTAC